MKAEDYFLTLSDDVIILSGIDTNKHPPYSPDCKCFCCDKFGYHHAVVTHKPTGILSVVMTRLMELHIICHEECSIAAIEDPVDVAIRGLKVKIKDFCVQKEKEEKKEFMNKQNELAGRIIGQTGYAQSSLVKILDVMRRNSEPLNCEQIATIEQIKEIGNNFYAFLGLLDNGSDFADEIDVAKQKLEECIMWAVKGVSDYGSNR